MIAALAKMLGLSTEHAEASMHSDRAARAVLTRRNLFAAGAALATGAAFSFAAPEHPGVWIYYVPGADYGLPMRRIMMLFEAKCRIDVRLAERFALAAQLEKTGKISL